VKTDQYRTELGNTVLQLVQSIPFGVLLFVPSYKLLSDLSYHWRRKRCVNTVHQPTYELCSSAALDIDGCRDTLVQQTHTTCFCTHSCSRPIPLASVNHLLHFLRFLRFAFVPQLDHG
jgi:hypothetical protein